MVICTDAWPARVVTAALAHRIKGAEDEGEEAKA
jgi:hypothetical protein